MKREDFKKIIKLRSFLKIDKRKGNYTLPNGKRLSDYITSLVESQMKLDNLGIMANGDLCTCTETAWNEEKKYFEDYTLMPSFQDNESCSYDDMEKRIKAIVFEIIG